MPMGYGYLYTYYCASHLALVKSYLCVYIYIYPDNAAFDWPCTFYTQAVLL